MIGIDTTFLIELMVKELPNHKNAVRLAEKYRGRFAIAPQVISEFIHVVSDGKRFSQPLTMEDAVQKAQELWAASDVKRVFPHEAAVALQLEWLAEYDLGRKRILDTQLAATYYVAGIRKIITTNGRDFTVFKKFEIIN